MQQFSGVTAGGATAASKAAVKAGIGGPFVPVGSAGGSKKGRGRKSQGSGRGTAEDGAGGGGTGYWQSEGGVNVGAACGLGCTQPSLCTACTACLPALRQRAHRHPFSVT